MEDSLRDQFRKTRKYKEIPLKDMARKVGISVPYLSLIERGEKEPSPNVLRAMGRAYEIQVPDIVCPTCKGSGLV